VTAGHVTRLSIDGKATVAIGDVSRGGLTRGDNQACDHDLGLHEKYIPCGIVDEASGQLRMTSGSSSKTSDFIVDALEAWWAALEATEQVAMARLQIKMDNGPESSGRRTQFLQRMVAFCDAIGKPIQLLYYPPTIASIILSSGAGASWNCTGTGPSWWMSRRWWSGPRI
jgi:hypothetical protein